MMFIMPSLFKTNRYLQMNFLNTIFTKLKKELFDGSPLLKSDISIKNNYSQVKNN